VDNYSDTTAYLELQRIDCGTFMISTATEMEPYNEKIDWYYSYVQTVTNDVKNSLKFYQTRVHRS